MTVLKAWTSPVEHSVIIHVRVRFEFPEVSATRLASGSLNSVVLCLVGPNTCWFLLWEVENGLLAIPAPHWPCLEATGRVFLPPTIGDGRSALCVVDRPFSWPMASFSSRYHIVASCRHGACQLCQLGCTDPAPIRVCGCFGPFAPFLIQTSSRRLHSLLKLLEKAWPFVLASSRSLVPLTLSFSFSKKL